MNVDWKYVAVTAAASVAVGIVAGIIADRILKGGEACTDDGWTNEDGEPDILTEDDYELDIPEGVNEVNRGVPSFELQKPNLEDMVDYTRFYEHKTGKDDEDGAGDGVASVHVISEEEFVKGTGNLDGYASVTGTWFHDDGILAGWDESLEVKDVSATVGSSALTAFEDPEVDAVYVRNDILNVLYEIVRGEGSYENAVAELSYSEDQDEG